MKKATLVLMLCEFKVSSTQLINLQKNLLSKSRVAQVLTLDFNEVYYTAKDGFDIYLVRQKGVVDSWYALRAFDGKTILNELLFIREKTADLVTDKFLNVNSGESFARLTSPTGSSSRALSNEEQNDFKYIIDDCEGRHGGEGFCQREKGESFQACYNAEMDEFCDSFASCIAATVTPFPAILIGIACSCMARVCPTPPATQ
jgi:hypothetical protein